MAASTSKNMPGDGGKGGVREFFFFRRERRRQRRARRRYKKREREREREREMTRTVKRVVLSIFRRQFHLLVF